MIVEDLNKYARWSKKVVTRICDDCGLTEHAPVDSVMTGRKSRGCNIDLCWKCSQKYRAIPKGQEHGRWRHGKTIAGYKRITLENGRRVLEHVLVAEDILGRRLQKDEVVHHIDLNKCNNTKDNLFICSKSNHQKYHYQLEAIGYSLLNDKIFFDWKNSVYSTKYQKPKVIDIDDLFQPEKTYLKTDKRYGTKYVVYSSKESGKWTYHRLAVSIMERIIERSLKRGECVHHVDGNPENNRPDNLCLIDNKHHKNCHNSLQKSVIEYYPKIVQFNNNGYFIKGD